jgi:hypothetical protein
LSSAFVDDVARLYGLTCDELRYTLRVDPKDAAGGDYLHNKIKSQGRADGSPQRNSHFIRFRNTVCKIPPFL